MLQPKKSTAADFLKNSIKEKEAKFSSAVMQNTAIPKNTISQEELASTNMGLGNLSVEALDMMTLSSDEKQARDFKNSASSKEMEKQNKVNTIDKSEVWSKVKEAQAKKFGEENADDETIKLIDNSARLNELQDSTVWGKIKNTATDVMNSVFNPLPDSVKASLFVGAISKSIENKPFTGLSKEQNKEFEKRSSIEKRDLAPIVEQHIIETQRKRKISADKRASEQIPINTQIGMGMEPSSGPMTTFEGDKHSIAESNYNESITQMEDYLSGDLNFWSGLGTQKKDLATIGVNSMYGGLVTVAAKNKSDRIEKEKRENENVIGYIPTEKLSSGDEALLMSYASKQEVESLRLDRGQTGYGWGKGVGQSLVMMQGMISAGPLTGGIEKGVAEFFVKGAFENSLKEIAKQGGKKALMSTVLARAAGGAASLSAGAVATPMMYQQFAKDNLGQAEIIKGKDGTEKVLIGESRYNKYKDEFDKKTEMLTSRQELLSKKQNLNGGEKSELETLTSQIAGLKKEFDMLVPKSHTTGESLWYGFSESVKENFSEKYVGEALPGVFNNMATRRVLSAVERTNLGGKIVKGIANVGEKASQSLVGKGVNAVVKGYNKTKNLVNNAALGKLSGEAIAHTGRASLINGLPGEVAEEVWNQFMPTYKQDYQQQLEELTNPDFYIDVIAQTLIMGGGFAGAGMAARANNYRLDKNDIKRLYKGLDASMNDADLAKHIMMNTGGTLYNPSEYDYAIHQLKEAGKTGLANTLEQKKFVNLAGQAIRTGTIKNFEETLEKLQSKPDISSETKLNLQLAKGRIQELKNVYDEHSEKDNFPEIFSLAERKLANKQAVIQIDKDLDTTRDKAKEEIDAFIQREGITVDYSMETLLSRQFDNAVEQDIYHNFLDGLEKEGMAPVKTFTSLLMTKGAIQDSQNNTMKMYNEQINPKYAENVAERKEVSRQYDALVAEIEGERVLNNSENDLQQTPEMVDQFVMELKNNSGGTIKANVFDELAAVKKEELASKKLQQKEEKDQATLNYLLEQRKIASEVAIENGDGIVSESAPIEVYDDVAENEFIEQLVVETEDTISLFDIFGTPEETPKTIPVGSFVEDPEFDSQIGSETEYTPEQLAALKASAKRTYDRISEVMGKNPTFREFMHTYYKFTDDKEKMKQIFSYMVKGWESNNYPTADYQSVYDELFSPEKGIFSDFANDIMNIFTKTVTTGTVSTYVQHEEATEKAQIEVAKKQTTVIGYDEENMPLVKSDVQLIDSTRTLNILPKAAFLALPYVDVNVNGVVTRETVGNSLNLSENSYIDPRDILNPDKFGPDSKFQIEIADETLWGSIQVSNGRNTLGALGKISFKEWVEQREIANPNFRRTQEFTDKYPIFYTDSKGKRLAYVQDTDWYNPYNVGNPYGPSDNPDLASKDWLNHIKKGIDNTRNLRNNINKGLREVTVNKISDGVFHKIPEELPKISITESNPQSFIVVQRGVNLHSTFAQAFNKGVLLNKNRAGEAGKFDLTDDEGNNKDGHTWYVNRIGFEKNDKGEIVPTYRALEVGRQVTAIQIETAQWALSAHLTIADATNIKLKGISRDTKKKFGLELAQAKQLQQDIYNQTGFDIENTDNIETFIKLYFQGKNMPKQGSLNKYREILFNSENILDLVSQHTNMKSLGKTKNMIHISKGNVESQNMNYEDYLKQTLLTNVKSFNVGTDLDPVYATAIQPIVNISYTEVVGQEVLPAPVATMTSEEARMKAVNAALEKMYQENEAKNTPLNAQKHIDFLRNIGVDALDFDQSDAMIADTSKLENIFKVVGNLNILQEKTIRQFILHSIGEKVSFEYKFKISETKIKEEIRSELNLVLNKLNSDMVAMLAEVTNSSDSSLPMNKAISDAYAATITNIVDIKANYKEIYDKAFKDIQLQTKLTVVRKNEIKEETIDNVLKEDLSEDQDTDDVSLTVKDYNKDSIEESGKAKASYRLRRFLHKINRYDNANNKETGYLGLPVYMSFNDVYNELSKILAMGSEVVSDYNKIIEKLKLNPMYVKHGASSFVGEILTKLDSADEQIKNEFVSNFVRHTLVSKFAMYEKGSNGITLKIYNTNSNEATRIIDKKWKNDNRSSGLYNKDGSINKVFATEMTTTLENLREASNNDYLNVPQADLKNWLEKIGITLEDSAWEELYNEGVYNSQKQYVFQELFTQDAGGLFVPIYKFLKEGIESPIEKGLDSGKTIFSELNNVMKALTLIEAKYNPNLVALSFRDSGKNISTLVPTKYITDMVSSLKRSVTDDNDTLIEDLQSLSFSKSSIILEMLQNEPTFKNLFEIAHLSLTAVKEKGDTPLKAGITDLGEIDYDIASMTGFTDRKITKLPDGSVISGIAVRMANMLIPTMSDKSTGMFMTTAVFDFMSKGNLLFEKTAEGEITSIGANIKELLFDKLVLPELERIVKFHREIKATNIKDYDNGAQLFHLLPIMNTLKDEDGTNILAKIANQDLEFSLEEVLEKYKDTFVNALESVVKNEVEHKKALWAPYTETNSNGKVISNIFDSNYFTEVGKNPANDYELGIYDFVLNGLLFNSEIFKVFAGDVALYSKDKNYKEDGKKISPSEITKASTYISINKEIGVNLGKRLALLIAPGNKIADSYNEQYNQIFLEDSIDITENAKYLIGNFYGETAMKEAEPLLNKYTKAVALLDKHEEGILRLNPERYNNVKNLLASLRKTLATNYPDLDAYFDIESTDAQEYSTATEHISVLHRYGRISDEEFKLISTKLLSVDNNGNPTADGYLTKEELELVFQPIKPVHTGTYINKKQDVNRVVYIKSSSFPLIPQLTAGNRLNELRLSMERLENRTGRFTRASYQTANKVGSTVNTINPFDVNSLVSLDSIDSNTALNDESDSRVLVLKRDNFRIQQDVPFKSDKKQDDKVSMGTQFFKLLFGDGVVENYTEENRDKFAHFPLNGEMVTGKELYNHYNKSFTTIVQNKKAGLFLELGLAPDGKIVNQNTFMVSLQELLYKEASSRGYSIKSLAGLTIEQLESKAGFYYEFKTPLWLSSDSNRYESLLNSIITNRLMKHKMPGNGFIAGSESGFKFKSELEGIEKSRIIYLDNWNGKELQGAHTTTTEDGKTVLSKNQIFVPSKFKDANKQLINLFEGFSETTKEGKYIYRRDNGTLGLKEGAISPELMNMFTFRTPTSSHVSGSSVEIAGILPPEVGDLMIVPKNFTKQKGLDYDIDKESAYQLNHYVNEAGQIVPLTQESVNEITQKLKDKIAEFNRENTYISSKSNAFNELFTQFINENSFGNMLDEESLETLMLPQLEPAQKLSKLTLDLEIKLAENEFIKSHLAVFNSTNNEIQKKTNKILSIDFAKDQANIIEKLNEEGKRNAEINDAKNTGLTPEQAGTLYDEKQLNFTLLTGSYQKSKMDLGSIGKVAIGVYANYTTFNGLLQQNTGEDVYIQDEEGNPAEINIGKFNSDGTLGMSTTLSPIGGYATWKKYQRSIADVFAEKENTATDNEKEQVLGRVGVNDATINVDAYLTLLGFDKDENGNSIPYMLLSQPIIKEFNKRKKDSKGILGTFLKEEALIDELTKKYGADSKNVFKLGTGVVSTVDASGDLVKTISFSALDGKALLDGIEFNGKDDAIQLLALDLYISLEKQARALSTVQKTINANSLGKSMIESQLKYEALKVLPKNKVIGNVAVLLGDFATEQGDKTDGVWIGDYYVTANTPQGQIVINGFNLGNTIYQDFFPYQDPAIINVVKEILAVQGKQEASDSVVIENFEDIVENIKKYVYSRKENNIFNIDPKAKRFELFKDTDDNTSLSTYLKNTLRNTDKTYRRAVKSINQNPLIKTFSYETGVTENELSLIKYNNTVTDNLDEEDLYNSIPNLIIDDEVLPDRNGQPYSTRLLAQDLASYAYLQGGIQKATEFVKFVPVEYLESVGMYEGPDNKFVPANRKLQFFSSKLQKIREGNNIFEVALGMKEDTTSTFTRQYFQHNPDKAPKASYKDKKNEQGNTFNYLNKEGKSPAFISIKGRKGDLDRYGLYEHAGNSLYHKIDVLGNKGVAEYEWKNENVVGINTTVLPVVAKLPESDAFLGQNDAFVIDENTSYTDLLTQISNADLSSEYTHLIEAAKWLLPLVKKGDIDKRETSKLRMTPGINNEGEAFRVSLDINLNPIYTTDVSKDRTALVFIHELIHTLSVNEVFQYFETDGITLKKGVTIPAHVTNLVLSFNHFRNKFKNEISNLDIKMKGGKDSFGSKEYTNRERELIYAGVSIQEFITVSLTSFMFQEEMNKVEYRQSGESIWERIKKNILDVLEAIYPGLKDNTIAKEAVMSSFNFVQQEANNRMEIEYLAMMDMSSQYEMEKANANEQALSAADTSREVKREDNVSEVTENEVNLPEEEMDPFNCK